MKRWFENKVRPHRIWPTLLVTTLSLQISGIMPICGQLLREARAGGDAPTKAAPQEPTLVDELDQLNAQILDMVRCAEFPSTKGCGTAIPSDAEIDGMEGKVDEIQIKVDDQLRSLTTLNLVSAAETSELIRHYFDVVQHFVMILVSTGRSHDRNFIQKMGLHIRKDVMMQLPKLYVAQNDVLGQGFSSLVGDDENSLIRLHLSQVLVEGFEVGNLIHKPDPNKLLTLIQYLVVRQYRENLASLRYIRKDRDIKMQEIPAALAKKLPTLSLPNSTDEQLGLKDEMQFRVSVYNACKDNCGGLNTFVDDAYADGIARVLAGVPMVVLDPFKDSHGPMYKIFFPQVKQKLNSAEKTRFAKNLMTNLGSQSLEMSRISKRDALNVIRYILSAAKAGAQLEALGFIKGDDKEEGLKFAPEQLDLVETIIEAQRQKYEKSLNDSILAKLMSQAQTATLNAEYSQARGNFIHNILNDTARLSSEISAEVVNMRILTKALSGRIDSLKPGIRVVGWLQMISQMSGYKAAQRLYAKIIAKNTSTDSISKDGVVYPEQVRRFVERTNYDPQNYVHQEGELADVSDEMIGGIGQMRKKDVLDMLSVGEMFGFHKLYYSNTISVSDAIKDNSVRQNYKKLVRDMLHDQHPVLSIKLKDGRSLFEALEQGQADSRKTEEFIDEALVAFEANIRTEIERVGNATSLDAIQEAPMTSMIEQLVMVNYPEAGNTMGDEIDRLRSMSPVELFMNVHLKSYISVLGWAYTAHLLLTIVNWGAKAAMARFGKPVVLATALLERTGAYLYAYFWTFQVAFVGSLIYTGKELYDADKVNKNVQSMFLAGMEGRNVMSYSDAEESDVDYRSKRFWWRFNVATYLVSGGWAARSWLKEGSLKKVWEGFLQDLTDFDALKLKRGSWNDVESQMDLIRAYRDKIRPDQLDKAEAAYARLIGKIKHGMTWNGEHILKQEPLTDLDRSILKLAKRYAAEVDAELLNHAKDAGVHPQNWQGGKP